MELRLISQGALFAMAATRAGADPVEVRLPSPVCEETRIAAINARLATEENNKTVYEDPKKVVSAVTYTNGKYGVSYDYVPALSEGARVGDKIRLCKVAQYIDCPKGDDRGQTYRAFDFRTGKSWTLMNSEHVCGGA